MSRQISGPPIGRQLAFVAKQVAQEFNAALAEAGGSLPIWLVLSTLEREDWPSQQGIAQELGIEGPTLTRHIDVLESMGLVERRRDAADRRAVRVESTEAGRELYLRLLEAAIAFDKRLRAGFTREELDELRMLLKRLSANVGGPARPDRPA